MNALRIIRGSANVIELIRTSAACRAGDVADRARGAVRAEATRGPHQACMAGMREPALFAPGRPRDTANGRLPSSRA